MRAAIFGSLTVPPAGRAFFPRVIHEVKGEVAVGHLHAVVVGDGLAVDAQPAAQLLGHSLAVELPVGAQSGAEEAEGVVHRNAVPTGGGVDAGAPHRVGQGGQAASVDNAIGVQALRMDGELTHGGTVLIEGGDPDVVVEGKGVVDQSGALLKRDGLTAGIH